VSDTKATTLFTIAEVKTWLTVTDASDDARLIQIADAVSERIDAYCRRTFVTRTGVVELHDGNHKNTLFARNFPIIQVGGLTVLQSPSDTTPSTYVSGTDFDTDKRTGRIRLRLNTFTRGFQNVTLTYDHGFDRKDGPALPQDVYQAGLDYCKLVYSELSANAIAATTISAGNSTFVLKPAMPWGIKQVLDGWVRRSLP
jgi:gp6-like head-tail connector protein